MIRDNYFLKMETPLSAWTQRDWAAAYSSMEILLVLWEKFLLWGPDLNPCGTQSCGDKKHKIFNSVIGSNGW